MQFSGLAFAWLHKDAGTLKVVIYFLLVGCAFISCIIQNWHDIFRNDYQKFT